MPVITKSKLIDVELITLQIKINRRGVN